MLAAVGIRFHLRLCRLAFHQLKSIDVNDPPIPQTDRIYLEALLVVRRPYDHSYAGPHFFLAALPQQVTDTTRAFADVEPGVDLDQEPCHITT